ncbi:hypothetical protein RIR_jg28661.t2 [Rhizophagus irregularis DAOM 181602=DAOM 197198]|nr:hypothetical protein RIR_jg28661.t2 [Rhizophagus irregularis DAOM 181602=DAOM 197198]
MLTNKHFVLFFLGGFGFLITWDRQFFKSLDIVKLAVFLSYCRRIPAGSSSHCGRDTSVFFWVSPDLEYM